MSTISKFMERLGPRVQIRAADRVSSGSPARLRLTAPSGADTPKAARILLRRHLPLRTAHAVLTEMVDRGKAYVTVPCVENFAEMAKELASAGIEVMRHAPQPINVRAIREHAQLSQEAFSVRFGLDLATLRNWEQGRSQPDAAAKTLLWTIAKHPEAVEASLTVEDETTR